MRSQLVDQVPEFKAGTRVRLARDFPDATPPMEAGLLGTVVKQPTAVNEWHQFVLTMWPIAVQWDDGGWEEDAYGNPFVMMGLDEIEEV